MEYWQINLTNLVLFDVIKARHRLFHNFFEIPWHCSCHLQGVFRWCSWQVEPVFGATDSHRKKYDGISRVSELIQSSNDPVTWAITSGETAVMNSMCKSDLECSDHKHATCVPIRVSHKSQNETPPETLQSRERMSIVIHNHSQDDHKC